MKKRITMMLCFVLVLSMALCACGTKENLVGTWKGSADLAEAFNAEMAADPEMGKYLHVDELKFDFVLELKEDGTCSMAADPDSVSALVDQLMGVMTDGMEAYFTDMFGGGDVDIDMILGAMGLSLDDLVAEMKEELLSEESIGDLISEGRYKAENGKMYFSDDLESEINMDEYAVYTLEGDTLKLEAGTLSNEDGMMEYLFPMTLTRSK